MANSRGRRNHALGLGETDRLFLFGFVRNLETDAIDWRSAAVKALKWFASNSCFAIFVVAVLVGSTVEPLAREAGRSQAMRAASADSVTLEGPYAKGIYRLLTYLEPTKEKHHDVR